MGDEKVSALGGVERAGGIAFSYRRYCAAGWQAAGSRPCGRRQSLGRCMAGTCRRRMSGLLARSFSPKRRGICRSRSMPNRVLLSSNRSLSSDPRRPDTGEEKAPILETSCRQPTSNTGKRFISDFRTTGGSRPRGNSGADRCAGTARTLFVPYPYNRDWKSPQPMAEEEQKKPVKRDEDPIGKVYDSRLVRRLGHYLRPYWVQATISTLAVLAQIDQRRGGAVPGQGGHRPLSHRQAQFRHQLADEPSAERPV